MYSSKAAGDAVVGIDATGEPVVVGTVNRRGASKACAAGWRSRYKIHALEITALLRARGACLQQLEPRTFGSIHRIEMRVRPGRLAAVETAHRGVAARLEGVASAAPARPGAAVVDLRRFICIGSDEVMVEVGVVKLSDRCGYSEIDTEFCERWAWRGFRC